MARHAAFCLDHRVLENEWPLFVHVACEANGISGSRRPQFLANEPSVLVVTIRALYEPFFHTMMEGHVELGFPIQMAAVAQLWLLHFR
jgi:hypothetical protein